MDSVIDKDDDAGSRESSGETVCVNGDVDDDDACGIRGGGSEEPSRFNRDNSSWDFAAALSLSFESIGFLTHSQSQSLVQLNGLVEGRKLVNI